MTNKIMHVDDPALSELCALLRSQADEVDVLGAWPARQLSLCGEFGVYEWFLPADSGGQDWPEAEIIRGYLRLSAACLTTTFIITQRTGACLRIAASDNQQIKDQLIPDLISGKSFATVGISHLTTSRRHIAKPVLQARETDDGFVLDGFSPWVTGGAHASTVVIGATLDDGREILVALPMNLSGVSTPAPAKLVALSASHTGAVRCDGVRVDRKYLLAGPIENVMTTGQGGSTGGLQTSTLAIGLAGAAIEFLEREAEKRSGLLDPARSLRETLVAVEHDLRALAAGNETCTRESLRARANSLVLRATQAALSAAKGTGFVQGHPAGRWCREALFFLVWSCPQPVMAANLCEFAGLGEG